MAWRSCVWLLSVIAVTAIQSAQWPVPYRRYESRPEAPNYCQAQYTFCPTGIPDGKIPVMEEDDEIEVFALKAPVWEWRFGDLLGKVHIYHDAMGFRNKRTGENYTSEWYELFQLFNCSFPHIVPGRKSPLWCNQGAACFYKGITDEHWKQNGTITLVTTLSGQQFNKLADYIHYDNATGVYYETFQVDESDKPDAQVWFYSWDCSSYILRLWDEMHKLGAKFYPNIHLNYTRMHLYSRQPVLLGNTSEIFGVNGTGGQSGVAKDIMDFYADFQPPKQALTFAEHLVKILEYVLLKDEFYFYFNDQYWHLAMNYPVAKITYGEIPLPGQG